LIGLTLDKLDSLKAFLNLGGREETNVTNSDGWATPQTTFQIILLGSISSTFYMHFFADILFPKNYEAKM